MTHLLASLAAIAFAAVTLPAAADCQPCGPGYCMDTQAYKGALAEKQVAAKKAGYPSRLVDLYGKLDRCELCLKNAPDGFSLMRVAKDSTITISAWTAENEKIGAKDVKDGKLRACHAFVARRHVAGCGQPPYDKRSDYDAQIDLSKDLSTPCS